jgi:hypothetical protein
MTDVDEDMPKDPFAPVSGARLVIVYLAVWLGCGLIALALHVVCAPDYIDASTRVIGGVANLCGPWARPLAAGWPNAGKPPHAPSAAVGLVALVLMIGVVMASLLTTSKVLQYLCIAAFVPLVAIWIGVGFLELMVCAA